MNIPHPRGNIRNVQTKNQITYSLPKLFLINNSFEPNHLSLIRKFHQNTHNAFAQWNIPLVNHGILFFIQMLGKIKNPSYSKELPSQLFFLQTKSIIIQCLKKSFSGSIYANPMLPGPYKSEKNHLGIFTELAYIYNLECSAHDKIFELNNYCRLWKLSDKMKRSSLL